MRFFHDFKKFINKGNVIDLAVGVALGTAFNNIVTSLVNDILMPPIGKILNGVDFSELYINLSSQHYASLKEAKNDGAATINYGLFLNNVLRFLIVALSLYVVVRVYTRLSEIRESEVEKKEEAVTKDCPFCLTEIPEAAVRCPSCTSYLETAEDVT
ncbi:large conductance mechanosensitive channel protein MscL [Aneurinibacillus tyrosinisolvens]|uniref:large conductance mechanosensitive channel protein MscL n=1 Tax=Aneurinibacillus tyrosinisolvens TaxID=1443435 RepID=UPI00063F1F33